MSKNNENKLVQNLRFPGFSKSWVVKPVSEICEVFRGSPLSKADLDENGTEPCIHYGELFTKYAEVVSSIYSKTNRKNGFKSEVGDVLMPSSDVTPDGLAKASAIMLKDVILGGDMNILRPSKDINPIFLSYLLNRSKRDIIKLVSGTTVKHIYPSQISTCPLSIIDDTSEQQKIAACLSSLDEVITAEGQKLEVLKDHKKGLLQNLLPQAGETVPKFRFKEFEDSGEWVETSLGEIGEPLMCKRIFKEETTTNPKDGIPFYKIGTFGRLADSYISKEIYEEYKSKYSFPNVGDILISASGTIGRLVVYNGSPAYFQDSNIIWLGHNEEKVLNKFLLQCYTNLKWQTSDGGVISRLYNSDFKRMKICFSEDPKEQEKIADTLSSVDDLIKAQIEKVESLQLHKKGLLQGLFPNVNEVTE